MQRVRYAIRIVQPLAFISYILLTSFYLPLSVQASTPTSNPNTQLPALSCSSADGSPRRRLPAACVAQSIQGRMWSYMAQVGSFCAPPPPTSPCAGAPLGRTTVPADSIAFAAAPIEYGAAYNSFSTTALAVCCNAICIIIQFMPSWV